MKQKLFFGLLALLALAPELISRRAPEATRVRQTSVAGEASAVRPTQTVREEGVALARRGQVSHDEGRYLEAVARFDSAAQKLPQITDWLNAFAATSISYLGDTAEVKRRLARLEPEMASQWAWRTRVRAYNTAKDPARALELALAAGRSEGSASKRAAALYVAAELQKELGRTSDHRGTLLRAIETASWSEGGVDAARLLAAMENLKTSERLLVGRTLLRGGEVTRGITVLRSFLSRSDDAKLRGQVRYEIGSALFGSGSYATAERELKQVPSSHARAADARFLIGRAQYRQGKVTAGLATFRKVAADYPKSRAATRALFLLGDLAQDDGRLKDAISYFQKTAARHELGGDEPALALMRLGGIHLVQKNYQTAQRTFETYRERFPRGSAAERANFWAARAAEARGQKETARTLLQQVDGRQSLSYYDIRAAELLGREVLADLPAGPPRDTLLGPRVSRGLGRWGLLREIGWNEAAAFELSRLRSDVAGNKAALYTIAEELNEAGHAYAGIAIGRDLLGDGEEWNERLLRIMYPMPYQSIILREARSRGLDPYFVTALMRQESRFYNRAVSGAGAIGLMQVMPGTSRQLGHRVTTEELMDPELNIRLGTTFLADLMKMYDQREDAVLVAYNAGPTRMDRWKEFPEFRTPDLFAERIPFDETREYVKVVRVNTTIYRALYGD